MKSSSYAVFYAFFIRLSEILKHATDTALQESKKSLFTLAKAAFHENA